MANEICIKFTEDPEQWPYKKDHYYWMSESDGEGFIEAGVAEEYEPKPSNSETKPWADVPQKEEEEPAPEVHIHVEDKKPIPKLEKKKKKSDA